MAKISNNTFAEEKQKKQEKKLYRTDINKGYVILYLAVFIFIIIGEIILNLDYSR